MQEVDDLLIFLQAFPVLYNWMTFPLTALLEKIFSQGKGKRDMMLVEMCSIAE